jgi:hypothetical protein
VKTGTATADDMRQDAVMEQLFEVVNNLLQVSPHHTAALRVNSRTRVLINKGIRDPIHSNILVP